MPSITPQTLNNVTPKILFGGRPYAIDLSLGYSDSKSTLTVTIVNESGEYTINRNDLSWSTVHTINVGKFSFKGYLIKYNYARTVGQKVVTLVYSDCSSELDKTQIGLHKKHGLNKESSPSERTLFQGFNPNIPFALNESNQTDYLRILGREINPVDNLLDNSLDENSDKPDDIDWCNPCINCSDGVNISQGRREQFDELSNLDVLYTFEDLLKNLGITVPSNVSGSKVYKGIDFTGSLRDVLNRWCQIYGLTFRWNPERSSIRDAVKLINLNEPTNISTSDKDGKYITETLDGASIEETSGLGIITYYNREGGITNYDCKGVKLYDLQPLQIADLYDTKYFEDDTGAGPQENYKYYEMSTAFSYYSSSLRDALLWFSKYRIYKAEDAKTYIINPSDDPKTKNGKTLRAFGDMEILSVITEEDPETSKYWENCRLAVDDIAYYDQESSKINEDDPGGSRKYYFIVARYNEELHRNRFDQQFRLATNFMGKYWTRLGDVTTCADVGLDSRNQGVSVESPEHNTSTDFYAQDFDYFTVLPFTNFGHTEDSAVGKFIKYVESEDGKLLREQGSISMGQEQIPVNILSPFMLAQREPRWWPNASDTDTFRDKVEYYGRMVFNQVGEGRFDFLEGIGDGQGDKGKKNVYSEDLTCKLFIVQETRDGKELPITVEKIKHFLEPSKPSRVYKGNSYNDLGGLVNKTDYAQAVESNPGSLTPIGNWGLMNNETVWITFDGFACTVPVGSCLALEDSAFDTTSPLTLNSPARPSLGDSTFRVAVSQDVKVPVTFPKIESMYRDIHSDGSIDNVGNYRVDLIDISNDDLSIFQEKSCLPNPEFLENWHKSLNQSLKYINDQPIDTLSITEAGVIESINLATKVGIDGITVRIGDQGAFTEYTFSDKYARVINSELLRYKAIMNSATNKKYSMTKEYSAPNPYNSKSLNVYKPDS